MSDQRSSDGDGTKRDIPSFIEPRPPLISNPFMRPRPKNQKNLLELFEEDSEGEDPELVQVYLRLKPCTERNNLYEVKTERCLITSVDTAPMGHGRRTQHNISKMYTFSHIFGPESSQKQIFEHVVKENLKKLPEGQSFTLLTYGASGSGKTYTLMGTVQAPGLVPRSLEYVFRLIDAAQQPLYKPVDGEAEKLPYHLQEYEMQFIKNLRHVSSILRDKYRRMSVQLRNDLTTSTLDLSNRTRYFVWVSFVEIYNEAIYDLLSNSDRSKATSKLRIREDTNGNVYVKGATQVFVRSGEEAYDVLVAGKHNLQVAATGVHANSSRSHCIFTITMLTETEEGVRTSCVRLCDLAGCERARHTRNTGQRMQESRAINSSLHVLERCLHMLRRKQKKVDATLVPYRESKLTRLLGSGLSGCKGEAVSMVVTLNPAPQFAHETRHVLQLAAVAKDIQVNQTIAELTLESSSIPESLPDTTLVTNAEIMRLQAENERLHFELHQAHTRHKELLDSMEETQQENAKTMQELVEVTKDSISKYYESIIQSMKDDMKEMKEEYESRLAVASAHADIMRDSHTEMGTPSRFLQRKIAELMTQIGILEEKLHAEILARKRAEEELQHARACIEERDEEHDIEEEAAEEEVMVLSDSDEEEDSNSCDDSLEPTREIFRKEEINRSRMLRQSIINDSKLDTTADVTENLPSDDNSVKNDTLKDDVQDDTLKDSTTDESNTTDVTRKKDSTYFTDESNVTQKANELSETNASSPDNIVKIYGHVDGETYTVKKNTAFSIRGTFVVTDENTDNNVKLMASKEMTSVSSSIKRIRKSIEQMEHSFENVVETSIEETVNRLSERERHVIVEELYNMPKRSQDRNVSLAQFEQLEKETKNLSPQQSNKEATAEFFNQNATKGKRTYFNDDDRQCDFLPKFNKDKTYFENIDVNIDTNKKLTEVKKLLNDERSPSIVKEDVTNHFEPSTIKKLLGESFSRQPDMLFTTKMSKAKKQTSVDIFESPCIMNQLEKPTDLQKETDILSKSIHLEAEILPQKDDKAQENIDKPDGFTKPTEVAKSDEKPTVLKNDNNIISKSIKPVSEIFTQKDDNVQEVINKPDVLTKPTDMAKFLKKPTVLQKENDILTVLQKEYNISSQIFNLKPEALPQKDDEAQEHIDDVFAKSSEVAKFVKNPTVLQQENSMIKSIKLEPETLPQEDYEAQDYTDKTDIFTKPKDKNETLGFLDKSGAKPKDDSILEKCIEKVSVGPTVSNITHKSIENLVLINEGINKNEITNIKLITDRISKNDDTCSGLTSYDSVEDFEKIYKETTIPKVSRISTEFEQLITPVNESNVTVSNIDTDKDLRKPKYNLRHVKLNTRDENKDPNTDKKDKSTFKKTNDADKNDIPPNKTVQNEKKVEIIDKYQSNDSDTSLNKKENIVEVLLESQSKCESKQKMKRSLRLRRRKNHDEIEQEAEVKKKEKLKESDIVKEDVGVTNVAKLKESDNVKDAEVKNVAKLKESNFAKPDAETRNVTKLKESDIVNLQKEFSDVTLDVPAPVKPVKDIESPDKNDDEENIPPTLGIQSCPSKSITRSRRKLFTPRPEPLDESTAASGDSNEGHHRLRVPRPSYHRTRVRRKL